MEKYKEGYMLQEDEYLLKIDGKITKKYPPTGFLTKLTLKGELPKNFVSWREVDHLKIYIFKEIYRSGWKLFSWRFGMSQNWAILIHPEGFTVEIYLDQFLDIVQENTIENGTILGEFKWEKNKLIKK